MPPEFPLSSPAYPPDIHVLQRHDQTILLVGTAHISQHSVDLVHHIIAQEQPDTVCIELDEKRYQALTDKNRWQSLNLKQIIKDKQLSILMVNLLMASYQKKLGDQLGVLPGAELLAAAQSAQERNIPILLCDRDIRITLRRAWKSTTLLKKGHLLATLFASLFDNTEIDEDKLAQLKEKGALDEMMDEISAILPDVKKVLIDERDIYLSETIKTATGKRIVAVVGAGHVPGIKKIFATDNRAMIPEITTIPPVSAGWKLVGWAIPLFILGSLVTIGFQQGEASAGANLLYWILAHSIPTAIGGIAALAHPLTIIAALIAAPITSLNPLIGAGHVAAFTQVMMAPPVVKEFESVTSDMGTVPGWWKNKLLRVFLIFILTSIGSSIGTYLGGYEIIKNLIHAN